MINASKEYKAGYAQCIKPIDLGASQNHNKTKEYIAGFAQRHRTGTIKELKRILEALIKEK